ncbi:MAG: bifunctional adenosylcobinamide kinase/adenosylcobinamide-phosphate guanylyltransferase [Deltaproteobacteria bacterium]|nr:bifunctional adenosylcobinamide kinase/adenosylcobinamide-phosphate guanylyltransferase [Deltaproteobacteria bacterium]
MDRKFTLFIGGARSGKTGLAIEMAADIKGRDKKALYMATARPLDKEMRLRIKNHREERGASFDTVEAPCDIKGAMLSAKGYKAVVIDCLTLWLANLMEKGYTDEDILKEAETLVEAVSSSPCAVFMVTNEAGCGIVPANRLARRFRDISGLVNQKMAKAADEVYFVTAGLEKRLK